MERGQTSGAEALVGQEETLARIQSEMAAVGIDEQILLERTGLGMNEMTVDTEFGSYKGPFWDAIKDSFLPPDQIEPGQRVCPIGDMVQDAYRQGGQTAVQEKLTTLSTLDSRFVVSISSETQARGQAIEAQKKN